MFEALGLHRHKGLKAVWVLGVAVLLLISLLPKEVLDLEHPFSDKVLHFLAYLAVTLPGALAASSPKRMVLVGLGMVVLGLIIEVLQGYIPGRYPELLDGLANLLGVLTGAGIAYLWRRRG
ncbi:MAG: VanZ family protein [Sphingomonadales bacterium]